MKKGKVVALMLLVMICATVLILTRVDRGTASLKRFKSYEELKGFLEHRQYRPRSYSYPYFPPFFLFLRSTTSASIYITDPRAMSGSSSGFQFNSEIVHSDTNVQVEGVDEADIVKTDGEYIYIVSGQKVVIVKAYPAEEAAVLARIAVNGTLKQIFINEDRMVIFRQEGSYSSSKTFIDVYDMANKENPEFMRKVGADGCYFSSRMIGDYVYVVVRKSASFEGSEVALPKICIENQWSTIPATEIYYSDIVDYGYAFTTILSVNVQEDGEEPIDETVLSGSATNIYVSMENIYLAIGNSNKSILHRIHIEDGEISYVADGQVSGTVLNQFSMDEHEGYFRIATTSQPQQNNVYILNMNLELVGNIENIAPGESIHSARFMGDICYLVTFRKVDPFFVINLSDPYNPTILGELKITGYSDYLHPYDENHIIGVGKETVAAEEGEWSWFQGVKISLFDVTNMSDPKELAKYEIGDRGTDSPVLNDHKAFLFDRERNLLVLPVAVAEVDASEYPYGIPPTAYGELVWQGACVFTVSLDSEEKIMLKGNITHIENGNVHNTSCYIVRTLYIDNVLYTVSEAKIKMNSLLDLSEINEIDLNE